MENKTQKRIVTRVGDIFCIELKKQKVFFQFIAVDSSELNSATIRVFQKKYSQDYVFDAEEVINDEVMFYAHTCLQPGLKQGIWTKVGKSKDVGDIDKVLFRRTHSYTAQCLKSYRWWIGGINKEYIMVGELTEEYKRKTHIGWVVPPTDIVEKIEFGEYQGLIPY